MILAVDIGNSNIVLGVIRDAEILFVARIATDATKTEDQYAIEIKDILHLYEVDIEGIDGAIISSVVPPLSNVISIAIRKVTRKRALLVGPGCKTGLNMRTDNVAQVGSDLVTAAVAAIAEYPHKPLIIIDMGTATTISIIDKDGCFIGVIIMPGVILSLKALSSGTAQLPGISLEHPKVVIGRNTQEAMLSGSVYGSAASIDGMIERIEEELGQKATVIATGGIARLIVSKCKTRIAYDADLMLKGLRIIYMKNKS